MPVSKKKGQIRQLVNKKNKLAKPKLVEYTNEEMVELENACQAFLGVSEVKDKLSGYLGSGANKKKLEKIQKNILLGKILRKKESDE